MVPSWMILLASASSLAACGAETLDDWLEKQDWSSIDAGIDAAAPCADIDAGLSKLDASTDAANDSASDGGHSGLDASACAACRASYCTNYMGSDTDPGPDLVKGCFEQIDTEFGAAAGDPTFLQQCKDIVTCAEVNGCGFGPRAEPSDCYCGSASPDQCASSGPASDALCRKQWEDGARSTSVMTLFERFTDVTYPVGWAYALIQCENEFCSQAGCAPR
ncbi:MAG TPA: hypothetical protein VG963_09975 [Polyangiaceae bacterium]|nr:hypothetical protein [Polyangiaceae bacterium]